MAYFFKNKEINEIAGILESQPREFERGWSWSLVNRNDGQALMFTIYNNVQLGADDAGSLITVQTKHGYFELHHCDGFIIFEPDEIIFFHSTEHTVSSLIIGKECTCSLFSDINRDIINADFTSLDPAVLMSAMQLSLTEEVLP